MKLFQSMGGEVTIEVTSADISGLLTALNEAGITIRKIINLGDLVVHFTLERGEYRRFRNIILHRGDEFRLIRRTGIYWGFKNLLRRPVLVAGIAVLLLLTLFLPSKVLFITVEGDSAISQRLIIEQARMYGIYFGADRRSVRSERVKNGLLEAVPQLQWVGVNTKGCVAQIRVRERNETEVPQTEDGVSSIVAVRDGVIKTCTVNRGTAMCSVGQAVTEGQVLISGYTDCGLSIRADRADGEVLAETHRSISARTPEKYTERGMQTGADEKFSLIIGKFRINFYKDSGILDTSCVKMYSENYITLPGGFCLPVAVGVERYIYYDSQESETVDADEMLTSFAQRYLSSQMIAGQILHRQESVNGCLLEGQYACLEMIGRVRYEESLPKNEDR